MRRDHKEEKSHAISVTDLRKRETVQQGFSRSGASGVQGIWKAVRNLQRTTFSNARIWTKPSNGASGFRPCAKAVKDL